MAPILMTSDLERADRRQALLLYPVFLASGAAAILYQIVWQRALFRFLGTSMESVTMIVTAFMLGLGLGSLAGGVISEKSRMPLALVFGFVELGIGAFGLVSLPLFGWIANATSQASGLAIGLIAFAAVLIPRCSWAERCPSWSPTCPPVQERRTIRRHALLHQHDRIGPRLAGGRPVDPRRPRAAVHRSARRRRQSPRGRRGDRRTRRPAEGRMIAALGLAFLSGFIALSYEILWYRAFSFASGTAANTFGLLLGAYLLGLALGALAIRRVCRDSDAAARSLQLAFLVRLIVFANLIGFLVVPCLGWLMTAGATRTWSLVAVGVAAAGLGTVFPLLSHLAIEPDDHAGRRVSYVYLTNILGSTAGSLGTGFVLMDHLSLAATHVLLFFLGLAMAMLPLFLDTGRPRTAALAAIGVLGLAGALFGTKPFDGIYEKLQLKTEYTRERRFKHVVETGAA
jgi:predicted membrane-bound spermidine synthase